MNKIPGLNLELIARLKILTEIPALQQIFRLFKENGHEIRLIGGCVRDACLEIPVNSADIDLAATALPEEMIEIFQKNNIKFFDIGKDHGTIAAHISGQNFEITSLRHDAECDGRHAKVEFTKNWQKDAERRDFTINAMSFDGEELFDYFEGLHDLFSETKVKFIGDAKLRIKEDFLRILRFFRFNALLAGKIHAESLEAAVMLKNGLKQLSKERVTSEFRKLLNAPNASSILEIMLERGILSEISKAECNLLFFKNFHSKGMAKFFALFPHQFPFSDFVFSNKEIAEIQFFQENLPDLSQEKIKILLEFFEREKIVILAKLFQAQNGKDHEEILDLALNFQIPQFPVSGDDFLKNGKSGKEIGEFLTFSREIWRKSDYLLNKNEILERVLGK